MTKSVCENAVMRRLSWLVIAGCLLLGTVAWAEKPKTTPVSAEVQLRQKLRNANWQYLGLKQQEASYTTWQIIGEIRDRDDEGLLVWGIAASDAQAPYNDPGWQTDKGNIYVANYDVNGITLDTYVGHHYYRGKSTGTNAFGANVPIKVYGDHPDPNLPLLIAATDVKRTDCANKYVACVYGLYDPRLKKNPKDAALRVEFAGRCLAASQEISGITCNYNPTVRAGMMFEQAAALYIEKGIPERAVQVVIVADNKGVTIDTKKIVAALVTACPRWMADPAKQSGVLKSLGTLHEQLTNPQEKAALLQQLLQYGRQRQPNETTGTTISCALTLGVDAEDVTPIFAQYRAPFGVVQVTTVYPSLTDVPIDFQAGDLLIDCDGVTFKSGDDFRKALGKLQYGTTHKLTIIRNGNAQSLMPIIGQQFFPKRHCASLGFDALDISPQLLRQKLQQLQAQAGVTPSDTAEQPKVADDQHGMVVITAVPPDSPIKTALAPGDLILECDGQTFADGEGLLTLIQQHQSNDALIFRTWRDGKYYKVSVPW